MRKLGILAMLLLPLLVLYGCGHSSSSGGSTSSSDSQATASLVVKAKFPEGGKQGEIGSTFISNATASIEVEIQDSMSNYFYATLTPSAPSATIAGIAPGQIWVSVQTYDASSNPIAQLFATGTVTVGSNTFTATLINNGWKFASSIPLNKTLSNSTESVTGFVVYGYGQYGYGGPAGLGKSAITNATPSYENNYSVDWEGNFVSNTYDGVPFRNCDQSNTICGARDTLRYYVQFAGPNTSNNAVDGAELNLMPAAEYPDTISYDIYGTYITDSNRFAFFFGIPFGFDYSKVEGPYGNDHGGPTSFLINGTEYLNDVNSYATSRVTGANTMSGNIVEVLMKSQTPGTPTCTLIYNSAAPNDPPTPITCPFGGTSLRASSKAKALLKGASTGIGKAALPVDANGCVQGVQVSGTDTWEDWGYDLNSDMINEVILVNMPWDITGDICVTLFNATAVEQGVILGID